MNFSFGHDNSLGEKKSTGVQRARSFVVKFFLIKHLLFSCHMSM